MIHVRSFVIVCLLLLSAVAEAGRPGTFLNVQGQKIYVDYHAAAPGHPNLVLLNGLTYSTTNWDAYVEELEKRAPGLGILRLDLIGMGETLLAGTLPVDYAIPYEAQVELTANVMQQLGLGKSFVAGLSYGGGIAIAFGIRHPELVDQLILMAPFTEPLQQMDEYIRNEVAINRATVPMNPASDEELYDFFLRQFIYESYPSLEPSVLDNPYKLEGIFRMVQGIRLYDTLKDTRHSLTVPTHLMIADQDQYIPKAVHERFWKAVPKTVRASRIDISLTEHKIPEAIPAFAASWTVKILERTVELSRGLLFEGSTAGFNARSGSVTIQLQ